MAAIRCPWANLDNPLYLEYHDHEWGKPVHDDIKHFEMITLEGAQAGLSWETVLNKRAHYRKVFSKFDPHKIQNYNAKKIEALLKDPGIIRNRLKVESTISNAKAFIKIQKEFGSFDKYIWGFFNHKPINNSFKNIKDYLTKTELSDKISKDLKKRGFRFVGSTIIYAYMQAVGLVNDHLAGCLARKKIEENWYLYIIETNKGMLYTGITTDIARRFSEHSSENNKKAKYLRGKGPLKIVYQEKIGTRSLALKVERWVKTFSRTEKIRMMEVGNFKITFNLGSS